jgi:hypothetical protein
MKEMPFFDLFFVKIDFLAALYDQITCQMLETSLKPNAMVKILTVNNHDTGKFSYRLSGVTAAWCCSSLFVPGSPEVVDPCRPTVRLPFLFVRSFPENKF